MKILCSIIIFYRTRNKFIIIDRSEVKNNMARVGSVFVIYIILAIADSSCSTADACNCSLEATNDTSIRFNENLTAKTRFLYLKLNFLDLEFNSTEFAYLQNTLDVVDPLTWVLSIGGNGRLLLQSPFDFRYVSLGTLSASGVSKMDIDIMTPGNYTDSNSDECKMYCIVELLYNLVFDAVEYFQSTTNSMLLPLSSFNVCLEKQSAEKRYVFRNKDERTVNIFERLSESGHSILQSTVEYNCWVTNETTGEIDLSNPVVIPRDRAIWWIRWLLNIVSTLIVLFLPYLFFTYFDWQNPPRDNKIRIDTRPYPFGFFHFVFYSTFGKCDLCSLSCWLRYIFFFFLMTFLCCVQFLLPYLYVDQANYSLREQAAERLNVWTFDWADITPTCYSIAIILIMIISYNYLKIYVASQQKKQNNITQFNSIGRSYLTTNWIFPEADDKDIVTEICPEKGADVFIDNPKIWNLWKVLSKICNGKRSFCVKLFLMPLVVAYWIGQAIPLIYYTNIVIAVSIALALNKINSAKKYENIDDHNLEHIGAGSIEENVQNKRQDIKDVLLLYLLLGVPFLIVFFFMTSFVFFQMFIACSHLIEVVGYTLVGLIVNAKYVVSWIAFAIGIVIFLIQTVTGYSNSYVNLFYEIFDVSEAVASKLHHKIVSRDVDGVPQIDLTFFFHIAYKVKPWKPALFFIYVQLLSAAIFFLLGYLLLYYVDGLSDLNNLRGQSELFGAAVIGGILPIAKLLTAPQATVKCKEKAKRCKLETLIMSRASIRGGYDEENGTHFQQMNRSGESAEDIM